MKPIHKAINGIVTAVVSVLATAGIALSAPTSPLGTNLAQVADFSSELPFADHFKQARPWFSSSAGIFDDGNPLNLNEDGEVTSLNAGQSAKTVLFDGSPGDPALTGKRMIVRYEGDGQLDYSGQVTLLSRTAGRDVIRLKGPDVTPQGVIDGSFARIIIDLVRTNPANPVRHVRMTPIGGISRSNPFKAVVSATDVPAGDFISFEDAATQNEILFNPLFLNSIKTFRSIRFMDWQRTNDSTQVNFADRAKPSHQFWSTDKGVPLEAIAALSNLMGMDPWLNVPHLATDSYVRSFATLLRDQLNPMLRAHIEYSNETWNGIFTQKQFVENKGQELGLSTNPFEGGLRFYSRRSQRIFDIFEAVYGTQRATRIRRIMATQAAVPFATGVILNTTNAAQKIDAFAIAPYFGDTISESVKADEIKRLGVDGVFDWLRNDNNAILTFGSLPSIDREVAAQKAKVNKFSIPLITYEGGQHFLAAGGFENDTDLNAIMDAVNKDKRMKGIYLTYLNNWRKRSNEVFWHYLNVDRSGKFGRWGSREFSGQTRLEAPKFDALQTYISQQPLP